MLNYSRQLLVVTYQDEAPYMVRSQQSDDAGLQNLGSLIDDA